MAQSPESLKFFANRLAQVAVSDDGAEMLRRLQLSGLMGKTPKKTQDEKRSLPAQAGTDQVGIWERKQNTSHFTRRMDKRSEWHLWAAVGQIQRKGPARRVVLLGESVARGYLYEPQFNAAKALTLILESRLGKSAIEIIDLARTDLDVEEEKGSIKDLIISALLLEPDALIVFAGNNWLGRYSVSDLPYCERALREEGTPVLKRLSENRLQEKIRDLMKDVAAAYQARRVPLLWMIPEFNLGDWRDPVNNAPHLPTGGNREWIAHFEAARVALRDGQFTAAASLAQKMIELDQGVHNAGFYILADCSRGLGDLGAERRYLESARDALLWDRSIHRSPRRSALTQQTLQEEAQKYRVEIADLATVFKEYLKEGLPDRRLFLDYCHLTVEGLQVAMAVASSWVLRSLKVMNVPWRQLLSVKIAPVTKVQGEAAFLAALHNGHWYQSYELVHYYCAQALQLAPEIAKVMVHFIEMQNCQAPMLLSRPGQKLAELDCPSIQHYLLRNPQDQHLDRTVIDAMISVLDKAGINYAESLARFRNERSVVHKPTNLLDSYYCASSLHPRERKWNTPERGPTRSNYYKAYWHQSKFLFIGDPHRPVRFHLTCRLPNISSSTGSILIELNGRTRGEVEISSEWTNWDISVPAGATQNGINEIMIHWPIPEPMGRKALEAAIADTLSDITPEFYPIFGEIHSFIASDAGADQTMTSSIQEELRSVVLQK